MDLAGHGEAPLHRQFTDRLREAITSGRVAAGTRLPSTRSLAGDWAVSRNTVLQVFDALVAEGFLESRVGDGTYVARSFPAPTVIAPKMVPGSGALMPRAPSGYPFRALSRRGRTLIEQAFGGSSERPSPFVPDVPDLRAFPIRAWLRLMNEVSGRLTGDILVHVTNAGYGPLREAIAHHLRTARGLRCTADQVIVTTGSQQSLDLVTRLLLERGDPVWMEEPGYVGARATLLANGCAVLPVPTDHDGMDIDVGRRRFPTPRMVFVSPARQYPTGATLSAERRAMLLDLSHRTGAWIVEDDYDCDFRYVGHVPSALQSTDRDGRVVHMGTFSKTLLPSFRLGFLVVPADLAEDFAKARAVIDRHAPLMEQMVLAEFMHRGLYAAHVRRMRSLYRERQQAMAAALAEAVGYRPPDYETTGGMHLTLPLHPDTDDQAVARKLWDTGVGCRALSIYFSGRRKRAGLLLGFAAYAPEDILAFGKRLEPIAGLVPTGS